MPIAAADGTAEREGRSPRIGRRVAVGVVALVVAGAIVVTGHFATRSISFDGNAAVQSAEDGDEGAGESGRLLVAQAFAPDPTANSTDGVGDVVTYAASNMLDSDPATAWRMSGPAAGESMSFSLDPPRRVTRLGLVNGYAKIDPVTGENRYLQGRRIIKATWTVAGVQQSATYDTTSTSVQYVDLPEPVLAEWVDLTIEEVTPPGDSRFDWTAVSDVVVEGTP